MAGLIYDRIIKYVLRIKCDGPLHIGGAVDNEQDVLVHPTTNEPFIQASSLAGAFRSYVEHNLEINADVLFGARSISRDISTTEQQSRIKFTDGRFDLTTINMELRPHVKIDRKTGSVSSSRSSGQKFSLEYIGTGACFEMSMYAFVDTADTKNDIEGTVKLLLGAMKTGAISIGAKKSSGAGKLIPVVVKSRCFNLKDSNDRKAWIDEESLDNNEYDDITASITEVNISNEGYKVIVRGKSEGAILIKGLGVSEFGENAPDSKNIYNANDDYIIPGSSIRGAIRSRMEKIANYLGKSSVIDNSFGKVGEDKNEGFAGNLYFADAIIGNKKQYDDIEIRHRIHIDKFTGGVFQTGLFSEQNAYGDIELEISINDRNKPDATLGLLMLALRDFASKIVSFGSGYATGKGYLDVSEIEIQSKQYTAKVLYQDEVKVEDDCNIIQGAIDALKEVS